MKVLTIHDLEAIKKRAENALLLREQSNEAVAEQCCGLAAGTKHLQILICGGTGCKASASHVIAEKLQQALEKNKITDQVNVMDASASARKDRLLRLSPTIPSIRRSLPKMRKK